MFLENPSSSPVIAPRSADSLAPQDRVSEANHRIANSLSAITALLHMRSTALDPHRSWTTNEVRTVLAEVRARIDAVARLHRVLTDAGDGPVDVGTYLQQITSELVSSLSTRDTVTLHFVCELGVRIAPERALYLGMIVVELVTNSLKYAHPAGVNGAIAIRCQRGSSALVIDISDDGVGFPEGFDAEESKSSGLHLIRSLAERIGGLVSFCEDLGCHATIHAPTD